MNRSFIFAAAFAVVASGKVFAHEALPETQLFRDQITKNPLTAQVLNFCQLAGLMTEDECRNEMYGSQGSINSVRIDAASKCVQKSGMEYRARLDDIFDAEARAAYQEALLDF